MILIADSGSTKTHWSLLTSADQVNEYFSKGINPFYQDQTEIQKSRVEELLPHMEASVVTQIFFYGAGCANAEKNAVVERALQSVFPQASIEIASDLLGACRGLFGRKPGIGCILGTGSNSCYYDGEAIVSNVSPLGFILGDEGSGANLGKNLVADILKNQLTPELKEQFLKEFDVTPADIIDRVYRKPFPNRYLASLSRFLINHIEEQPCYDIVYRCFYAFFERNIMQYENAENLTVNFIGSVAYYYRDILEKAAKAFNLKVDIVIQSPMPGLIQYHS